MMMRVSYKSLGKTSALLFVLLISFIKTFAWVYPEHRQLSFLAIQHLSPQYRAEMDRLWMQARTGYESRLSQTVIQQVIGGNQLDYASWAGISGDHSCSPADMLNTVLRSGWIGKVEKITSAFAATLAKAKTDEQRINATHLSDVRLMKADDAYATRAGSNSVHFLLPRSAVNISSRGYFTACTAANAEPNALATYAWFHTSAVEKANRYSYDRNLSDSARNELILGALADEAFAVHFLQDIFAAGHIAGSWGKPSQKKGTHDHYNEAGLEIVTWSGKRMIVMGDSYLDEKEAERISIIVRASLEQLIDAANGRMESHTAAGISGMLQGAAAMNVCTTAHMPEITYDSVLLNPIIVQTPIPGLTSGPGSLPRVNAELGSFIGVSAALIAQGLSGGFGVQQTETGGIGGMEANIRFGVGLEGLLNRSGDGLTFIQIGWKQESASTNSFFYTGGTGAVSSALASAIPARAAYNARIRLPYFLLPGDLILASPLYLFAPKLYTRMAETAVNGGLLHLQSGIATRIGRIQFVFGRELGLSFYGLRNPRDYIIVPIDNTKVTAVEYRSTKIDLPLIEFTPARSFSQNQTSTLMIQMSVGVDVPYRIRNLSSATDPLPELKSITYAGLRVIFNWRKYL